MDLKNIVRTVGGIGTAIGSYYLWQSAFDFYDSPNGATIKNNPFPLLGLGAGATFACATEAEGRPLRNPIWGIAIGMLPNAITSAVRWNQKSHQYLEAVLGDQSRFMQFCEDMAGVGVVMGIAYALPSMVMNGFELYQKRKARATAGHP